MITHESQTIQRKNSPLKRASKNKKDTSCRRSAHKKARLCSQFFLVENRNDNADREDKILYAFSIATALFLFEKSQVKNNNIDSSHVYHTTIYIYIHMYYIFSMFCRKNRSIVCSIFLYENLDVKNFALYFAM